MKKPQILIISNKTDITTDFVIKQLTDFRIPFYRFNTEELTNSVFVTLDFTTHCYTLYDQNLNTTFSLLDFKSVYYRRPELPSFSSCDILDSDRRYMQSEVAYTLEGIYSILHDAFWISPVWAIRKAENKIMQLIVAEQLGFDVPPSIVSDIPQHFNGFITENTKDCIIKPIHTGHVIDSTHPRIVFTNILDFAPSDAQIRVTPNYLQKQIHKVCDIRVTVVGNTVFAVSIMSQQTMDTTVDWRKGEQLLKHKVTRLPDDIQDLCVSLVHDLGLQYGAIDLILDTKGNYIFLEINPNGQWAWIENLTSLPISREIAKLLIVHSE